MRALIGTVTEEQFNSTVEKHILRFQRRIDLGNQGHRGIRLGECEKYLSIWISIRNKRGVNLNQEEINEVEDAYDAGEFE